jgi:hypothetical protein
MSNTLADPIIFSTVVRTACERSRARLLIDSIRSFGGALSHCPIWLFEADSLKTPCDSLAGPGIHILSLSVPETIKHYIFADKVYACARAEELAAGKIQSLVWIDPGCMVVNSPLLFDLGPAFDAAVRPVHIKNVGLGATEPLDVFWKKIYATVGVQDIQATVQSFVDGQTLRAYFNSHAFAVNPSLGLLCRWLEYFQACVCDQEYQLAACQGERHQIFLFQAILSALLVTALDPQRIRILPHVYNYPYNLHPSVPIDQRARALNDLVSIAYEERSLDPNGMDDIQVDEPLRSWLSARVNPAPKG